MATWCMQCGSANTPRPATGVDDEGEPACNWHRVAPPELPQPATNVDQPETREETMKPEEMKKCPGVLGEPCPHDRKIGPRAKVCNRCYARQLYREKYAKNKKTAPTPAKQNGAPPEAIAGLAALKADLLRKIEAIELVEALLCLDQLKAALR